MHICIFQTGEPIHIDNDDYRPMRAISLSNKLNNYGHKVTLITSCFFHQRKTFRSKRLSQIKLNENLRIILIPSLGYKRHIGFKRILDHIVLAYNLNKFLRGKRNFKPDKIFLGYPPIETSLIILNWAKKINIPVMLDVKDNWPVNFLEPFPNFLKPLANIALIPYYLISKYIFRNVEYVNSISNEFIDWIKGFSNKKSLTYMVTPLVREPIKISKSKKKECILFWNEKNIDVMSRKHFCFVGSITKSFDFDFIFRSANFLKNKHPEYKFIICGSGDQFESLLEKSHNHKNVFVFGEINKFQANLLIKQSCAIIAPYFNSLNFRNSIPNKIIEGLENSVPYITNLEGNLKDMINTWNNGIFIPYADNKYLYKYLNLINDHNYQKTLSKNARKSYQELFNFSKAYDRLVKEILYM